MRMLVAMVIVFSLIGLFVRPFMFGEEIEVSPVGWLIGVPVNLTVLYLCAYYLGWV